MIGILSIYRSAQEYFCPEEEPGNLNGYEVSRLSPDMEENTSVQKAIETAKVILLLDVHTDPKMHKANAGVMRRFFDLNHDFFLYEGEEIEGGFESTKEDANLSYQLTGYSDPTTFVPLNILKRSASWEPEDDNPCCYTHQLYAHGAMHLGNALWAALNTNESEHYAANKGIKELLTASIFIDLGTGKEPSEDTIAKLKNILLQHSLSDRLRFIEELCQKQKPLLKKVDKDIEASFAARTDSMIEKTLAPLIDQRVQKVWITCGMAHGIGDPEHYKNVERFYAALDKNKISYVTLHKKTPKAQQFEKYLLKNPSTYEEDAAKLLEEVNQKIENCKKNAHTRLDKLQKMCSTNGYNQHLCFHHELYFLLGQLLGPKALALSTLKPEELLQVEIESEITLDRIAYWAKKFRENLEAKTAAA